MREEKLPAIKMRWIGIGEPSTDQRKKSLKRRKPSKDIFCTIEYNSFLFMDGSFLALIYFFFIFLCCCTSSSLCVFSAEIRISDFFSYMTIPWKLNAKMLRISSWIPFDVLHRQLESLTRGSLWDSVARVRYRTKEKEHRTTEKNEFQSRFSARSTFIKHCQICSVCSNACSKDDESNETALRMQSQSSLVHELSTAATSEDWKDKKLLSANLLGSFKPTTRCFIIHSQGGHAQAVLIYSLIRGNH